MDFGVWREETDTTDPKLAAMLQGGERIWLKRHWRNIASASAGSVAPLFAVAWRIVNPGNPPPALLVGFLWAAAAWLWWRALASRLRFTESSVEATDQNCGLFQHRVRLSDVVAACVIGVGLDIHARSITNSHYAVYAAELTPGRENPSRWVALWITPYAVNASTLLAELRRRCGLTQVSPAGHTYGTRIWPHPTVWQREGLDASVLPVPRAAR
jgi:hypothetical protein